jgi:hypothetical protein
VGTALLCRVQVQELTLPSGGDREAYFASPPLGPS